MVEFLINVILTAFLYMIVPVIISIKGSKKSAKAIKWILVLNSIVVFVLIAVIYEVKGIDEIPNVAPVAFWGSFSYMLLQKRCFDRHQISSEDAIKKRFCQKCGGEVNAATSTCDKCGKKYLGKKIFKKVVLFLLVGLLVAFCIYLGSEVNRLREEVKFLEGENQTFVERIEELYDLNVEYTNELLFYEEHAVIVIENDDYYHKYDCTVTGDYESFWIYNTENAEYQGYSPCPVCN